jgi:DNA-binding transcriptional ArsR family regulator
MESSEAESDRRALERVNAIAHRLRQRIMAVLVQRPASAAELAAELGLEADAVRYQLRRLQGWGMIEESESRRRRGALERYYVARNSELLFADEEHSRLDAGVNNRLAIEILRAGFADAVRSLAAGSFNSREDRALAWMPLLLDAEGWRELARLHADLIARVAELKRECERRLCESGEQPLRAASILACYEQAP